MAGENSIQLPTRRKKYTVKSLMSDLKKMGATPSVTDLIGAQCIYYEWALCERDLGDDHPVTSHLAELLDFMQHGYETQLVNGEFWRTKDTPAAAINAALRGRPTEFLTHILDRPADYVYGLLEQAIASRKSELDEYAKIESGIRTELEADPDNPHLWNKLRLLLWLLGQYKGSSEAFQKAKRLGWDASSAEFVAL
jgi:tetratricopeptide (TPR) repeat protein